MITNRQGEFVGPAMRGRCEIYEVLRHSTEHDLYAGETVIHYPEDDMGILGRVEHDRPPVPIEQIQHRIDQGALQLSEEKFDGYAFYHVSMHCRELGLRIGDFYYPGDVATDRSGYVYCDHHFPSFGLPLHERMRILVSEGIIAPWATRNAPCLELLTPAPSKRRRRKSESMTPPALVLVRC